MANMFRQLKGGAVLAVTKKVAREWGIDCARCAVVVSGHWVVDVSQTGNKGLLCLATHQDTLFTIVYDGRLPEPQELRVRIGLAAPWFALSTVGPFARNGNRRVTGSMRDMKLLASSVAMDGGTEREIQDLINKTPYSMLGMARPRDVVAALAGDADTQ